MRFFFCLALLLTPAGALTVEESTAQSTTNVVNPIRKVVTMLQMMMNKIEAEGKKETELYDKFMCYCKTGEETLGKSIEDANTKIPQLESDIKAGIEEKKTLEGDVEAHQGDRDAAKQAMAKASQIREKEGAAFAKESANDNANIDALTKAIPAIEKGMAGGFLQTSAASVLRKLTITKVDMLDID